MVAADCVLFRDRFLWRLRGDVSPGNHHSLTCLQNKLINLDWCYWHCYYNHWKTDYRDFHLPGEATEESGLALVAICWGSGCVGDPLLPDYSVEIRKSPKFMRSIHHKLHNMMSDISVGSPSRKMLMFALKGSWIEGSDPSTPSEQEEGLLCPAKHQLTLENHSFSPQMGSCLPELVLTSLQSSGQIVHL